MIFNIKCKKYLLSILLSFPFFTFQSLLDYLGSAGSIIAPGKPDNFTLTNEMDSLIVELYLGFRPIYGYTFKSYILQILSTAFIPSIFGGGRLVYHTFCYFELKNGNTFIVEYSKNGITVKKADFNDFRKEILSSVKGKKFFKEHDVHYMHLIIKKNKNLYDILKAINSSWKSADYNFIDHNCHHFVNKFLFRLKAKRGYKENLRGNHFMSVYTIPMQIVEQLEKNEKDSLFNIPFLGNIYDIFDHIFVNYRLDTFDY